MEFLVFKDGEDSRSNENREEAVGVLQIESEDSDS